MCVKAHRSNEILKLTTETKSAMVASKGHDARMHEHKRKSNSTVRVC